MRRETRIGIFVGTAFVLMAVLIYIVGDLSVLFRKPGYTLNATFTSAAGLDRRADVKMAGVLIGYVKDIRLAGRKALVVLAIGPKTSVPKNSRATLSQLGLLGEKHIEIVPGDSPESCREGDTLPGETSLAFDEVGPVLVALADDLRSAVSTFRGALDEETRAGVKRALTNAADAADELRTFLDADSGDLGRTTRAATRAFASVEKSLADAADDLKRTMASLRSSVGEGGEAFRSSLETIRDAAGRIEESLNLLNELLEKIGRGEGTVGRLVQDPGLYDDARAAVRGVTSAVGGFSSLRPSLDLQASYYGKSGLVRAGVAGRLGVTPRAFLEAELVRDPWDEAFKFSFQGGTRFGNFAPRAGFIESEFGLGVDYYGPGDRWRVSVEGFDWNRAESPRLRLAARFAPRGSVYLLAGLDDFSLARRREFFVGLGMVLQ